MPVSSTLRRQRQEDCHKLRSPWSTWGILGQTESQSEALSQHKTNLLWSYFLRSPISVRDLIIISTILFHFVIVSELWSRTEGRSGKAATHLPLDWDFGCRLPLSLTKHGLEVGGSSACCHRSFLGIMPRNYTDLCTLYEGHGCCSQETQCLLPLPSLTDEFWAPHREGERVHLTWFQGPSYVTCITYFVAA